MWIGNLHVNMVEGDLRFLFWKEEEVRNYKSKTHQLRCEGYRKIDQHSDFLNDYEYYRKKGKKKVICVVRMYP